MSENVNDANVADGRQASVMEDGSVLVVGHGNLNEGRAATPANRMGTVIINMAAQSTNFSSLGIQLQKRRECVRLRNKPNRYTLAYKAGLKVNDIIVAIEYEGNTVNTIDGMREVLQSAVGSRGQVAIHVERSLAGTDEEPPQKIDEPTEVDDYDDAPGTSGETPRQKRLRLRSKLPTSNYFQQELERRKTVNMTQKQVNIQRERHRVVNMTPEQIVEQRERHRVVNMAPERIVEQQKRRRVANMTPEQIVEQQERHRVVNMTYEQIVEQQERHRVVNMTYEQIVEQQERHRVVNMTPEQIVEQQKRRRVANMTLEQVDAQRVRAGTARRHQPILNCARGEMADVGTNVHLLGRMDVICRHCNAKHWIEEKLAYSSMQTGKVFNVLRQRTSFSAGTRATAGATA